MEKSYNKNNTTLRINGGWGICLTIPYRQYVLLE